MIRVGRVLRRVVLGAVLAALVVGGVLLVARPRLVGRIPLPRLTFDAGGYVGSQLIGIVNSHLKPEFAFGSIEYDAPGTVRLSGVSLTAPDGTRIVDVERMTVTLAETPRPDRPIKIARIAIADGVVRMVGDGRGGLVGFSDMRESGGRGGEIDEAFRLSSVLVLERVELDEISIEYRASAETEPLRLDHVASTMDVRSGRTPGWHEIAFASGRGPGLELNVDGRVNLDTFDTEIDSLRASIDAGPDTTDTLPGPLASLLKSQEVGGRLVVTGRAALNVRRPLDGTATVTVSGEDLHAAYGDYQIPVASLRIASAFAEGVLTVEPFEADLLHGSLRARGTIDVTAAGWPAKGSCAFEGIDLREALRRLSADEPPKLAGILDGHVDASTLLESARASLTGSGEASVKEGRLVILPGLTQLSRLINRTGLVDEGEPDHRGTALFTLGPTGMTITESEVVTSTIAARGTGTVGFDRSIDLRVNAGPMEKLQSLLGKVGDLLGQVTDRLVKYTIKGTIDDPVVGVAPLGFD